MVNYTSWDRCSIDCTTECKAYNRVVMICGRFTVSAFVQSRVADSQKINSVRSLSAKVIFIYSTTFAIICWYHDTLICLIINLLSI